MIAVIYVRCGRMNESRGQKKEKGEAAQLLDRPIEAQHSGCMSRYVVMWSTIQPIHECSSHLLDESAIR